MTNWDFAKRFLPFVDVTEQEVFERLLDLRAHLWVASNSAGVTEVTDGNMLHIWIAGGDLRELLHMRESVEAFAKAMKCRGVEIRGRKGWRRIFPQFGYAQEGEKLVKYEL